MAMFAFRSLTSFSRQAWARPPGFPPPPRRETLAIVSTSSKLCGIAAYTAALQRQLAEAFDITVFDLNQYLLRSPHHQIRKLGDRHIKEICRAIRQFDAVNLQLEHGTLGRRGADIHRRFCWITDAAARLSVTFHTLPMPPAFDAMAFAKALATFKFRKAAQMQAEFRRMHHLSYGIARQLRRVQGYKPVSAIVHNRRDRLDARYLYGIRQVFDHPLSYLAADDVEAIRAGATRRSFPMLGQLPADAVLVGVFGFINPYKGIGTAIEALHYLPENHHLLIFGGVHPWEIAPQQTRHPHVSALFDRANIDTTLYAELGADAGAGGDAGADAGANRNPPQLILGPDCDLQRLLGRHPRDLSARIHFMGALAEEEFFRGMAVCDAVVFPYLEVGQSSSGPISQALELGCRIIASRTHTFLEFAEYHKNAIEFFDIGNHLELAERLVARPQFGPRRDLPEFNVATNKAVYLLANSTLMPPPPLPPLPPLPAGPPPTRLRARRRAVAADR
jgi:glycosyltransferase involved in cell wall biosynthesis